MKIEFVKTANIRPSEWSINHILTPDLKLLIKSIQDFGWMYPILVRAEDSKIIDGFSRWYIATADKTIVARDRGIIPVQWIDCSETTAKIMHIRLNRARGVNAVRYLSNLTKNLVETSGMSDESLMSALGMTQEEFSVLTESDLIRNKKLSEYAYSNAWVPVEVAPEAVSARVPEIVFEKPRTPDH